MSKSKLEFQLSPKKFFDFFLVVEHDTNHLVGPATKLASAFSASVTPERYGGGVKSIAVALILTDPQGHGQLHKVKRPHFSAGVRTIKAHGLTVTTEDALEFGVRPDFAELRLARSESQLASAILPGLDEAGAALRKLKIPSFDVELFLSDLTAFFTRASAQGAYVH